MARKPQTPKPLTSTAAFRSYLREVDHLTELVAQDRLGRYRAVESRDALGKILEVRLRHLFQERLAQLAAKTAPAAPAGAELSTYVHPARLPGTQQEPCSSSSHGPDRPVADQAATSEGE